jgi:tetratricopeptide (TPR) repeat protein
MTARAGRGRCRAFALALALGACSGPPWFMGSPLDGQASVPPTRANPSFKALRAQAATARTKGQTVLELGPLIALDDLDRLEPVQRERLVTLLERRAAEFRALGRAIPESRDLDRLARLAPARAAGLLGEHAEAARAAGDAWLAVGAINEARAAYQSAAALGATDLDFRVRALWGHPPPETTTLAELRAAIAALPLRAVPPLARAYVAHGGGDRATLTRALAAARQQRLDGLAVRIGDALRTAESAGRAAADGEGADASVAGAADGGVNDAAPGANEDAAPQGQSLPNQGISSRSTATAAGASADAAAEPPRRESLPNQDGEGAVAADADGRGRDVRWPAGVPVPADLDAWALAGVTISARLLPLVGAHPEILADLERAVAWVDLLLREDETSPRVLELAALVYGRARRFGGTERMLMELAYATPDRADALARGAEIWEQLGRPREACAQWIRAARWRDDPEDPLWRRAIACTRRDPGAGDWHAIRGYVLSRARPDRRASLAATLDAP